MDQKLAGLIEEAKAIVSAMTPEQKREMLDAQARSWAKGEAALAKHVRKTVNADGSVTYHDYASYCLD